MRKEKSGRVKGRPCGDGGKKGGREGGGRGGGEGGGEGERGGERGRERKREGGREGGRERPFWDTIGTLADLHSQDTIIPHYIDNGFPLFILFLIVSVCLMLCVVC